MNSACQDLLVSYALVPTCSTAQVVLEADLTVEQSIFQILIRNPGLILLVGSLGAIGMEV